MKDLYRNLPSRAGIEEVLQWIYTATRLRQFDIADFNAQITENPRIFNAPTSSTDLRGTEKVGDVAADDSFFYVVVETGGDLEWRRVAISSF